MRFFERCFKPTIGSYFLFGPRGTGKSTIVKNLYKDDAVWIDLLKPDIYRRYLANPERLYELIDGNPDKRVVVIDEVQRVPMLLSIVHDIIETKRDIIFVLTGSSSRKLKKTGADLMAGRALKKVLHPFIASEMKEEFSLDRALTYGMIPLIVSSNTPEETLKSYIHLYIQQEVQAEGLIRNVEHFARFLEVISFSHASIINITNIARECEVKRKTVENYINILEDLMLIFKLPVFTKRAQREVTQHPKLYLFDVGVFYALRPKGILDKTTEIDGLALEGLVAQHLYAWNDYSSHKHFIGFWRTKSGVEVDFIVYGEKKFLAIEVKNNKNVHKQDLNGLKAFKEVYPEAELIMLYRGKEKLMIDGVMCIPCELFLAGIVNIHEFSTNTQKYSTGF